MEKVNKVAFAYGHTTKYLTSVPYFFSWCPQFSG